jgi:hypothetical protein
MTFDMSDNLHKQEFHHLQAAHHWPFVPHHGDNHPLNNRHHCGILFPPDYDSEVDSDLSPDDPDVCNDVLAVFEDSDSEDDDDYLEGDYLRGEGSAYHH